MFKRYRALGFGCKVKIQGLGFKVGGFGLIVLAGPEQLNPKPYKANP